MSDISSMSHTPTIAGTVGGTFLTVLATIDIQDIAKTIVLAVIGATVSFLVSTVLKWLWNFVKRS